MDSEASHGRFKLWGSCSKSMAIARMRYVLPTLSRSHLELPSVILPGTKIGVCQRTMFEPSTSWTCFRLGSVGMPHPMVSGPHYGTV
jgi:hypothetical protein